MLYMTQRSQLIRSSFSQHHISSAMIALRAGTCTIIIALLSILCASQASCLHHLGVSLICGDPAGSILGLPMQHGDFDQYPI